MADEGQYSSQEGETIIDEQAEKLGGRLEMVEHSV